MYYKPEHFDIRSFVSPTVWSALGDRSLLVMDYRMIITADTLAVELKKKFNIDITINDWYKNGLRSQSGFRGSDSKCAAYSQHRFGRAIDFTWSALDVCDLNLLADIQTEIRTNASLYPHITRMELNTTSWVHVDCAAVDTTHGIQLFRG